MNIHARTPVASPGVKIRADAPAPTRTLYQWHSWIGVLSGLLMFMICWSGSFATVSNELGWMVTPAMRVAPHSGEADLSQIHASVAAAMPDVTINSVTQPLYPRFAADVVVETAEGELQHVYVDPSTMRITGRTAYFNLQRFFRDFHMNFYGLLGIGKYVVTLFAIPLIASLVTALIFYKRWWRRFFQLRVDKGAKALWSSLHKASGLWSMWFVLLIGITSIWYLFEAARSDFIDGKFSYADTAPSAVMPLPPLDIGDAPKLDFSELLQRAKIAAPDLDINSVSTDRGGHFYVEGATNAVLVRDRANKMYLDPRDGRVVHYQTAGDLSAYWQWSHMADPLHFGSFGGLTTKVIWLLFGLVLSGLALTGGWLHLKRLERDTQGRAAWRGTASAAYAGLAIFAFCSVAAIYVGTTSTGVTMGTIAGAAGWSAVTLLIMLLWIRALSRPNRA